MIDLLLRQSFSARDADGASEALQAVLGVGTATVDSLGSLRYEQRSLVDDGVTATRLESAGALLRVRFAPAPEMVVVAVRSGYLLLEQGSRPVALEPGDLGLIPFDRPASASWEEVTADLYSFPRTSLRHLLGSGPGADPLALRVARVVARPSTVTELWQRAASSLGGEVLQTRELFESDLIREQAIDALLALTIEAFGISDAVESPVDGDGRPRIEAACEWMAARLAEPITMSDVARAAGLSVRGLQLAFQEHRLGTPLSRLRAIRMAAAHDAFGSDGSEDVGAVAASVGYPNVGRFVAHYRQAFGESPQETLAQRDVDSAPATAG